MPHPGAHNVGDEAAAVAVEMAAHHAPPPLTPSECFVHPSASGGWPRTKHSDGGRRTLSPCRSRCSGRGRGGRRWRRWSRRATRRCSGRATRDVAAEIDGDHTNESYLPGFTLPERLMATDDLEKAMRHAELLIVGVPTTAMRSTMALAKRVDPPVDPDRQPGQGPRAGIAAADDRGHRRRDPRPPRRRAHRPEHRPRDHGRAGRGERDRHRGPHGRQRPSRPC